MSVDLATEYLGLRLANPLVLGASTLGLDLDVMRACQDAGIAAVVLPSLFEEQIVHEANPRSGGSPPLPDHNLPPTAYLEHLASARRALEVPILGSLNAASPGEWVRFARRIEEAGADAIELNVYHVSADPSVPGEEVEARTIELVARVAGSVRIPIAVKIGPYYSSLAHFARRLVEAGASGLVVFNRFLQPDVDLTSFSVDAWMALSSPIEMRLPLRWIAILRPRLRVSLAASTGAHVADDAIKFLLAGADVVQMVSALIRYGPRHAGRVLDGIEQWMGYKGLRSIEEFRGQLAQTHGPDPAAYERGQYMKVLGRYRIP